MLNLICPDKENITKDTINKAKKLTSSVKVDFISARNIYFSVISKEKHSVIYSFLKGQWSCDCKYFALNHKICSHILAVNYKIAESAIYRSDKINYS